jgi:phage antirepressor YoqD-like protein
MELFSNMSNQNTFSLSKASNNSDLKRYFIAVLELSRSGEEFPVSLDEVWMLIYGQKSDAVAALKSNFIQDVDYQVLRQNPQNSNGGRPTNIYKLSVSCMEFFVARKIRPVFEVYRQVFHGMANTYQVPQSFSEALMLAAKQQQKIEQQQKAIEASRPKVEFFDAVADSKTAIKIGDLAKVLAVKGLGRNNLFELLRNKKILMENNIPYQTYVDRGYFRTVEQKYTAGDEVRISIRTLVYQKGVDFIRKLIQT